MIPAACHAFSRPSLRSTDETARHRPNGRRNARRLPVTPFEAAVILAAGVAAGTINAIVGSGSLITFPTLLAFGYAPFDANVSNTVGLVPGSISGAVGYRRELVGQRARAARLGIAAGAGGLTGGAAYARAAAVSVNAATSSRQAGHVLRCSSNSSRSCGSSASSAYAALSS